MQIEHIKAKGMKMTPGVSSFTSHVEDIGDYFAPLFEQAAGAVPLVHQASTEVHILGTAGESMLLINHSDNVDSKMCLLSMLLCWEVDVWTY